MIKRPGSDQVAARRGDAVAVGDDIRTGRDSAAQVTFSDDSFVNLFPQSALRVNQYSFEAEENRRTARIRVLGGRARFVLYKIRSSRSVFCVQTDSTTVISGLLGDFGVMTAPSETEVAVLAQSVRVRNSSDLVVGEMSLGVNQKTVIREKTPPAAPGILTPAERKKYLKNVRRFREDD